MTSRRRRYRYRPKPKVEKPLANKEITALDVRLVGIDGEQKGVVPTKQAIKEAKEAGFDLVIVAQKTEPPVARIMDIGKHMYEKRKKDAKQKAKSKGKDMKGVRIGLKTGANDWNLRLKQAERFLTEGHKVKLEIRLRGREKSRFDLAEEKLREFVQEIPSGAKSEDKISRSHNSLSVILTK